MADEKIYHINRSVFFTAFLDARGWRKGTEDEKGTFGMWFPHDYINRESAIQLYPKEETDVLDDKILFYKHLRDRCVLENIPETYLSVEEVKMSRNCSPFQLWFLKHRTGAEGKYVWAYRRKEDLMKYYARPQIADDYVVQKEVKNPLLVFGHKIVLRVYVLIHNKKLYIYKEFTGKICPKPYSTSGTEEDIHIRSIYDVKKQNQIMAIRGSLWDEYERIFPSVRKASEQITREFLSVLNDDNAKNQYTLLGLDYLIDTDYKPWLLEINSYPSLWDNAGQAPMFIKQEIINDLYGILIKPVIGIDPTIGNFEEI